MSVGAMLGDIVSSLFKKPVTQLYPFTRTAATENLRGKLFYNPEKCSGGQLCVKDCPADAIELIVIDKVKKRFVMRYHVDRCTFCNQCVQSCRFECLGLSDDEWELAALKKEPFTVYYGKDEDIQGLLERAARPGDPDASCES